MDKLKYIIVRVGGDDGSEHAILFPESIQHSTVARLHRAASSSVIAAGFCCLGPIIMAWGKSDSIPMAGRGSTDANVIAKEFGSHLYHCGLEHPDKRGD
jgi:hypothetical protein